MVSALAFDLGASSGRAVVGEFDGERVVVTDVHRFPNDPVRVHGRMYWDILRLFHEIKQGLLAAWLQGYRDTQSVGLDTWGVDFGLLGAHGELLGNPYHYRDEHTAGILEEIYRVIPREEIFARTGIQFLQFNTLCQIYALKKASSPLLDKAQALLLIPELLRYFLTGERLSEWSIASTTQLCNPHTRRWDRFLLASLGIPEHLFVDPAPSGARAGILLPALCEELGIAARPVVAVAEHDTASAVVAVPAEQEDFAYLSSGTWSLLGTEIAQPIINQQALEWNITNEGGINGTVRLLKNVTGLWLIQECRRAWRNEGKSISFEDEGTLVAQCPPLRSFIDPDDPMFINPAHMPRQIQQYCRQTGQPVPESEGEILRCIVDSLALRYRFVLERIEGLAQKRFAGLHVVGGGAQHHILCQCTANALARPLWAGPQEATALGNLLVQFISSGYMKGIRHARQVVRNSFAIKTYEPAETEQWESAYERFCQITGQR